MQLLLSFDLLNLSNVALKTAQLILEYLAKLVPVHLLLFHESFGEGLVCFGTLGRAIFEAQVQMDEFAAFVYNLVQGRVGFACHTAELVRFLGCIFLIFINLYYVLERAQLVELARHFVRKIHKLLLDFLLIFEILRLRLIGFLLLTLIIIIVVNMAGDGNVLDFWYKKAAFLVIKLSFSVVSGQRFLRLFVWLLQSQSRVFVPLYGRLLAGRSLLLAKSLWRHSSRGRRAGVDASYQRRLRRK